MKKRASGTVEKVAKEKVAKVKVAKVKAKQPVPAVDEKAEKHRMNRELLLLVDALAREKNVPKDIVFTALESALASATKKRFTQDIDARVSIDRETGEYESFRRWTVVPDEEHEEPAHQIAITDAAERDPELELGDVVEEPLEPVDFGRIGAQAAKQVIVQKIRDAEREQILNDFLERKDNLLAPPPGCRFRPRCPHAFEKCTELPALEERLPGANGHADRCWLDPQEKREKREVEGRIGLEVPA